jgi:hypothetical protein
MYKFGLSLCSFDDYKCSITGRLIIDSYTKSYIRCYFPKLPEDIVEAAAFAIGNDSALALVGAHLGIDDIVQTKEVPPNERTVSDAVRAIVGAIAAESVSIGRGGYCNQAISNPSGLQTNVFPCLGLRPNLRKTYIYGYGDE